MGAKLQDSLKPVPEKASLGGGDGADTDGCFHVAGSKRNGWTQHVREGGPKAGPGHVPRAAVWPPLIPGGDHCSALGSPESSLPPEQVAIARESHKQGDDLLYFWERGVALVAQWLANGSRGRVRLDPRGQTWDGTEGPSWEGMCCGLRD